MDASARINTTLESILDVSRLVLDSEVGIAQVQHDRKNSTEALRLVGIERKDTKTNLRRTEEWLKQQPDYKVALKMYRNLYFCYNPRSMSFQIVSAFLWDRYSLELDSWRDQVLRAYSLHHYKVTPIDIEPDMCVSDKERERPEGHRGYKEEDVRKDLKFTDKASN